MIKKVVKPHLIYLYLFQNAGVDTLRTKHLLTAQEARGPEAHLTSTAGNLKKERLMQNQNDGNFTLKSKVKKNQKKTA